MIPTRALALFPLMFGLPAEAGSRWLKNDTFSGDGPEEVTFMGGFVAGECWASVYEPSPSDYPFTPKYIDMLVAGGTGTANFSVELYGLDGTDMTTASLLGEGLVTLTSSSSEWNRVTVSDLDLAIEPIVGGNIAVAVCHEDHDGFPSIGHDSGRDAGDLSYIWGDFGFGMDWWSTEAMADFEFFGLPMGPDVGGDWIMRTCVEGSSITGRCEDSDPSGSDDGATGGEVGSGDGGSGGDETGGTGSDEGPVLGSCLLTTGDCFVDISLEACDDFGGDWTEDVCIGSCVLDDGDCYADISLDSCDSFGGEWTVDACPPPDFGDEDGSDETDGDETGGDETGDETGGDETGGDETGDETGGELEPVLGSCILESGDCFTEIDAASCDTFSGEWTEEDCPGSCILESGECFDDISLDACDTFDGDWSADDCPIVEPTDDGTAGDDTGAGDESAGDTGGEDESTDDTDGDDSGGEDDAGDESAGDTGGEDESTDDTDGDDSGGEDDTGDDTDGDDSGGEDDSGDDTDGDESAGDTGGEDESTDDTDGDDSGGEDDTDGDDSGGEDDSGDNTDGDDSGGEDDSGDDTDGDDSGAGDDATGDTDGDDSGGEDLGGEDSDDTIGESEDVTNSGDGGDTESKGGCSHIGAASSMHMSWIGLLVLAARRRR